MKHTKRLKTDKTHDEIIDDIIRRYNSKKELYFQI
jgi:hypothetical protein